MGCPLRIESAPFLIDLKFKSAHAIILRINMFPSPAGGRELGEGEHPLCPLAFILSPEGRGD